MMNNLSKILIIAGSDPSGGAGAQADIKTITAHNIYCSCILTCLTAQNTQKVSQVFCPPTKFLQQQLNSVFEDISFDIIKIGMLANKEIISKVQEVISDKSPNSKIILDPVMVATSGDILLENNAIEALKNFTKDAFLITPNIDEAEILSGIKINNIEDIKTAAFKIKNLGVKNVFIKAAHLKLKSDKISNILLDDNLNIHIIENQRLNLKNIHGTGCSLASAISCNLANKLDILNSVKNANEYIFRAIKENLSIGKGSLVLKHYL